LKEEGRVFKICVLAFLQAEMAKTEELVQMNPKHIKGRRIGPHAVMNRVRTFYQHAPGATRSEFEEDELLIKRLKHDARLERHYQDYRCQGLQKDGMSFTRYLTQMNISF